MVFSEIVPRLRWIESPILKPFEKERKRVNKEIEKFMTLDMGIKFRHLNLEDGSPGLFRDDGVHLSDVGLAIFNLDLQTYVEMAAIWGRDG